jgi:hypothetical protein
VLAVVALLASLLGFAITSAAASSSSPPTPGGTTDAVVRAMHLSPDTGAVDVYLRPKTGGRSLRWLVGLGYGAVSAYRQVPPGRYTVALRRHGAPTTTRPALRGSLDAQAGRAFTVAVVGVNQHVRAVVWRDQLALPLPGDGRIRIVQASLRAGRTTVTAGADLVLSRALHFGTVAPYATVMAGRYLLRAVSLSRPGNAAATTASVGSGSVSTLLVLDDPGGGIVLRMVTDAVGASVIPLGSVSAGGGGTAARPDRGASGDGWLLAVAAACLATGIGAYRLRLRLR